VRAPWVRALPGHGGNRHGSGIARRKVEFVEGGLKQIAFRFESDVKKGRMTSENRTRIMGLINGSTDHADARDAELVI
jgi:3-hydroxyacyl-CoA dehydrogenase